MEMIAGIKFREQICERDGVTHDRVEINQGVIDGVGAKPGIDCLTRCFVSCGVVRMSAEGGDGCAVSSQVPRVCFIGKLRVGRNKICGESRAGGSGWASDKLDALEENEAA